MGDSQVKVSDRWVKDWVKYYKSIPQQGLNNLTQKTSRVKWLIRVRARYGDSTKWKGEPTLPRRLKKIDLTDWMNATKLPYMYFAGSHITDMIMHRKTREDALPEIKRYTTLILERLDRLLINMNGVTVLSAEELEYWKEKIRKTRFHIMEQSKWVGLCQETTFEVIDIPDVDYSQLTKVMDVTLAYTAEEVTDMLGMELQRISDMLWKAWEDKTVDNRDIDGTLYWLRLKEIG